MSDPEIRLLERRVTDGDDLARVSLLRARVRVGLVAQPRLHAAAWLGDPVARQAGGETERATGWKWQTRLERAVALLPERALVEVACRWAERVLPLWASRSSDRLPHAAVAAARAWLALPADAPPWRRVDLALEARKAGNAAYYDGDCRGVAVDYRRRMPYGFSLQASYAAWTLPRQDNDRDWVLKNFFQAASLEPRANVRASVVHALLTPEDPT